nr:transcription-repair coupling factor [Thermonema rossianum]
MSLTTQELLTFYERDSLVQLLHHHLSQGNAKVHAKGLSGSLPAVLVAALARLEPSKVHTLVLNDREEAIYFFNDLQNLLPGRQVMLYPSSYRRPYHYEEVENANVLMRSEVLNALRKRTVQAPLIVTYPEALFEKVVNKRTLVENTFPIRIGDKLDTAFLTEFLSTYDFEASEFVYEPGQFAVRGGIIDVFSFADEYPYRIELFDDEVESIRQFDPETQLSKEQLSEVNIVPNLQTKFLHEARESFLEYLPKESVLWFSRLEYTLELLDKAFEKVAATFDVIMQKTAQSSVVTAPVQLFDNATSFIKQLNAHAVVEFSSTAFLKESRLWEYVSAPQPSFNKRFELLAEDLAQWQQKGYMCVLIAESAQQIERLRRIFKDIQAEVQFHEWLIGLRGGFIDHQLRIVCYTDHQIFDRYYRYKTRSLFNKSKAITLKELQSLQPGDYVTHIDYGIARFAGLTTLETNGRKQEVVRLIFKDNDVLYVNVHSLHKIAKYAGKEGQVPQISKLGSNEWEQKKKRVKKQVKDIAKELITLYAKRRAAQGFAFPPDNYLQAELESSFMYEDTPDQARATEEVKRDMEKPYPMDRLVCGDVGFGKTEVAIRAAFKAVCAGKQVAVLVPTTILAMQHYHTFTNRLADFPCTVAYINRFKSSKEIKQTLEALAKGEIDIIIGTHRLLNKDVVFKDLGLVIIDEEQKFGVQAKEKLKQMRVNVDCLTLTATPIPRTLHFSLMGARDLSVIATPPPNRRPVLTEVHTFSEEFIRDAIRFELERGGQVFFVHNRVNDIESVGDMILRLVPDAKLGIAHGQMDGKHLEKVMTRFIEGEYDILLSTNIIEAGLDIPNANTIIINHAHMFGLSDLHQMRGRVGRSNRKAFCYLLIPSQTALTREAHRRLKALEEFSDLGDGFKVAMRDLDIRGAGNLLGAEQSGFINDIGFETYHKILDEAIQEVKQEEFKELFSEELSQKLLRPQECIIETDWELRIPEEYVSNITERLRLYNELDNLHSEEDLQQFASALADRFGPLPNEVNDLLETVRLRWIAEKLGFEKLVLKNNKMKAYFLDKEEYFQSEVFGHILRFVQQNPDKIRLKESKGKPVLIAQGVMNVKQAIDLLRDMEKNA